MTFNEPQGELTADLVRDALALVSVKVADDALAQWTPTELLIAYDWAIREHLRASDNPVRRREKPWFVRFCQDRS